MNCATEGALEPGLVLELTFHGDHVARVQARPLVRAPPLHTHAARLQQQADIAAGKPGARAQKGIEPAALVGPTHRGSIMRPVSIKLMVVLRRI